VKHYDLWLFDCDGVILDSNDVKTAAFRAVGMPYGAAEAERLVRYHQENGGVSRYEKFEVFFRDILGERRYEDKLRVALTDYASRVRAALRSCPEVPGAREFLERQRKISSVRAFVISGSDEQELRHIFAERNLDRYFDGIFGSPARKQDIVAGLCSSENVFVKNLSAVLCGDSRLDYEVARACGIEFIMIYGYTEWKDWKETVPGDIVCARDFRELATRL
jgi:phosphoglycolate phosphatase-like HAD superfamily hydrolase